MREDLDLGTQVDDVNQDQDVDPYAPGGDTPDGGDGGGDGADKPFLKVNDRTSYMTEDDARRGFDEAGKTIVRLSPWGKLAREYGLTPDQAKALFEELRARRAGTYKDDGTQRTDTRSDARASATGGGNDPYAGMSEAEQKSAQWLEQRGWMRKDAIEQIIDERLKKLQDELPSRYVDREAAEAESMKQQATPVLTKLLTEAKLPASAKMAARLENFLMAEFFSDEADPEGVRREAYFAGGDTQAKILADGFKLYLSEMVEPIRVPADAGKQRQKTDAKNKAGAKLPERGMPKKDEADSTKVPYTLNKAMADDHDKAADVFFGRLAEQDQ